MQRTPTPFIAGDAYEASRALETIAPDLLDQVETWLPGALGGQQAAVGRYVDVYRALAERLVDALHDERPDLVMRTGDQIHVCATTSFALNLPFGILEASCLDAPASPWVVHYGARDGIALHLLATLRHWVPGSAPLDPPAKWWHRRRRRGQGATNPPALPALQRTFYFTALRELGREQPPLERIRDAFALNTTELGKLFGVSRQAMDGWRERGAPPARQPKIATVAALVDLLERQLRTDRIPGIARRSATAYGGQTMLEMIINDRHEELLELVRASFDWAAAA